MGQDSNAANEGDQLKHALLAEVLLRCLNWPSLTYAETHAGAGIYVATSQSADKSHIYKLKMLVNGLETPDEATAGGGYARLLKQWWSDAGNADKYPGSVLQAAITLNRRGNGIEPAQLRVTEAVEETHARLAKAVEPFGVNPKRGGFQNEIDWLTEKDGLVLLIDPFTYTEDKKALNKGHIDLKTLKMVLKECWKKASCVVGFWCAMGRDKTAKQKQSLFTSTLKKLAEEKKTAFRLFAFGKYSIAWIGIGQGAEVVSDIPTASGWEHSWLGRVIKEQCE